jgi:hypothetical protein
MTKKQETLAVVLFLVAGVASITATLIDLIRGASTNWLALGAGLFCVSLAIGIQRRRRDSSSG